VKYGWVERLDWEIETIMHVEYALAGRKVTECSVVLTVREEGRAHTVRVYDAAHGFNELHRHTASGGKQPGERFHAVTLGEGMRAAIGEVRRGYREMIEAWRR
jgi:hypothetical protein